MHYYTFRRLTIEIQKHYKTFSAFPGAYSYSELLSFQSNGGQMKILAGAAETIYLQFAPRRVKLGCV